MQFRLTFACNQQKKVAYEVGQYGSMKTFVRWKFRGALTSVFRVNVTTTVGW